MASPVLTPQALAAHLDDPSWVIVDCRFDLARPQAGAAAYCESHIPGAFYAHLDRDLSGPVTATTGRHPLPDPEALSARFGGWGIGPGAHVAAYDADNGMYAARLWWLLRWLGHDDVAVLDGGYAAWRAQGLPVTDVIPAARAQRFTARPRDDAWVDTAFVERHAQDCAWRVLDARAAPRYAGEVEPIDAVAGHVPGAHNYPFDRSLDESRRLRDSAELREQLLSAVGDVPVTQAIVMCGSGVTACHVLLALEASGLAGARLYAGSWSEWITDPARPVATGPAP